MTTTATAPKFKIKKKDGQPVGFSNAKVLLGTVSVHEKKISVRANLELPHDVARLVLAQGMLSVTIDVQDGELFHVSVSGTAETGKMSIGYAEEQGVTLAFHRDAVDVAALSQFAKQKALLTVLRQGTAGETSDDEGDE